MAGTQPKRYEVDHVLTAGLLDFVEHVEQDVPYSVLGIRRRESGNVARNRVRRELKKLRIDAVTTSGDTPAAREIAAVSKELVASIQRFEDTVERLRQGNTVVVVACFSVHVERVLAAAIRDLQEDPESPTVQISEGRNSNQELAMKDLFERLLQQAVHIAIGGPPHPDFEGTRLYSDNIVALLPEDHHLRTKIWTKDDGDRRRTYLTIDELAGERLLLPPEGFFSRRRIEEALAAAGISTEVDAELASPAALYELACARGGVPLFATDARLPSPPDDETFPVLKDTDGQNVSIAVHMHWSKTLQTRSPVAWRFKEYLHDYVRETGLQAPRIHVPQSTFDAPEVHTVLRVEESEENA